MNQNIINGLFLDVSISNYKIVDPIPAKAGEIVKLKDLHTFY